MQNTKNMHLKLSSVGQNWPQVAPSWRQVGPKKSTKFDKWPQVGAKLAPNGAKLASKLSQDLQMTPQRAPKEPPKTPLDGPKPRRNRSKSASDIKKNWPAFPPIATGILQFFGSQWKKLFSLLRKETPPWKHSEKDAYDMPKKNGGHSPLLQLGFCSFSAGSRKNCSVC